MPKAAKLKKFVHPNSRQAKKISYKVQRENRLDKRQQNTSLKFQLLGEKVKWFQDQLDAEHEVYSQEEASRLVEEYLDRFKDELEQIEIVNSIKGRSGTQHIARKDAIKATMNRERNEYESVGFEIPDILNAKHLKFFREWNGEMRLIQNIKLTRVQPTESNGGSEKTSEHKEDEPESPSSVGDEEDENKETEEVDES